MSRDIPVRTVRIEARWHNVVATRSLPPEKAGDFAARLRRRGWRVKLTPQRREESGAAQGSQAAG